MNILMGETIMVFFQCHLFFLCYQVIWFTLLQRVTYMAGGLVLLVYQEE